MLKKPKQGRTGGALTTPESLGPASPRAPSGPALVCFPQFKLRCFHLPPGEQELTGPGPPLMLEMLSETPPPLVKQKRCLMSRQS